MEKTILGASGLSVSRICLGTWGLGGMPFYATPDASRSLATVRSAIEVGISFVDTSPVYGFGQAETLLGTALQHLRDSVVLATKGGLVWSERRRATIRIDNTARQLRRDLEGSLRRLRTDHIDLYQIHWPDDTGTVPIEDTVETLEEFRAEGKVLHYGFSNFAGKQLAAALSCSRAVSVQNRHSILFGRTPEDLTICRRYDAAYLAYSPLHRGVLGGMSVEALRQSQDPVVAEEALLPEALATVEKVGRLRDVASRLSVSLAQLTLWLTLREGQVDIAIVGCRSTEHVREWKALDTMCVPEDELIRCRGALW